MPVQKPKWLDIHLLNRLRREAENHPSRQRYIQTLGRHKAFYRGSNLIVPLDEMGDDMELDEGHAVARQNKIKETVDKIGSIFMKNSPMVRRWPYHPEDADLTDDIDALYQDAWVSSKGQFVMRNMLQEAEVCGLSVGKIYWNSMDRSYDKEGGIAIEKLAPGAVLFDPWASNDHRGHDVGYIFHTSQQPAGYLLAKYGKEAEIAMHLRTSRGRSSKKLATRTMEELAEGTGGTSDGEETKGRQGYHEVVEAWIFPQAIQTSELIGGNAIPDDEYKYGMVVTVINDRIVRVMKNPFVKTKRAQRMDETGTPTIESVEIGHKRHPFVPMYWGRTTDPRGLGEYSFYDCVGMVESMIALQVNINALRRNIAINARTIANPVVAVNEDALDAPLQSLLWSPGQIYRIASGFKADEAIQILQGAQMPQYVFDMLLNDIGEIAKTAGLEPGVVGLFPTGGGTSHTPGLTIGSLQEAAFGPLWVYVAELSAALLDIAVLYDGLIQQYYTPNRYLTVSSAGEAKHVQFSTRHITANFRRQVVDGATTPLYDMEKQTRVNEVVSIVNEAIIAQLQGPQPRLLEVAIAHVEALNFPWAYQFQQILQQALKESQQVQQMMAQAAMMQQQPGQEALPQGQQEGGQQPPSQPQGGQPQSLDEGNIIDMMAEIEGRPPEEIAMELAG